MAADRNFLSGMKWCAVVIAAVATVMPTGVTRADEYPSRVLRIVVPTAPAGGYDFVGRAVADQLAKRLGQSVIVENRTGAGTVVGTQSVIAAPADGYTLLVGGLSNIIFNDSLYKKRPYEALAQLTPVAIVYNNSYVLVAPKELPFNSAKELAASSKAKSGEMRLAHPGVGTGQHLAGVAFMKYTGTKFVEVPYRGASAIYPDLISGRVDLFFDSTTGALPSLKGGQVKGLGVLMSERMKDAADIPTMKEEGLANLAFDSWIGIFAPANTPKPAIERLQKELAGSMSDLKARFVAAGGDTINVEPARLDSFVRTQHETWTTLIKEAGIVLE